MWGWVRRIPASTYKKIVFGRKIIPLSNTKAVKNGNMEGIIRMAMELCRRDSEELIREFWEEKTVKILENNMKILEMQLQIKKKEKENRGKESMWMR